jgi:hypothetical protein
VAGNASKSTAGSWLSNSDRRIKSEISPILGALEKMDQVRLVDFRYTPEYLAAHPEIEDRRYPNVIAQDFAQEHLLHRCRRTRIDIHNSQTQHLLGGRRRLTEQNDVPDEPTDSERHHEQKPV